MKKITLLLAAVACLCSGKANAQEGKGSINFVPYVGVNYSDFSGDTDYYLREETSGKVNFMAGARFEFQIADKSAIIADVNYRRLGANAKDASFDYLRDLRYPEYDYITGIEGIFKKLTLDCISFGPQYKQNIVKGLSVRVGVECSIVLSAKYHSRIKTIIGKRKGIDDSGFDPSNFDPSDFYNYNYDYIYYYGSEKYTLHYDDFDWYSYDMDDYSKITDAVSDNLKIAIPLGVSYDYKDFSLNATYHLPLTNCFGSHSEEYYLRNQAFDLTIGYRLPLRKR